MVIVPYQPEHLERLLLQPSQAYMRPYLSDPEYKRALKVEGKSFTAISGENILACAGVMPIWKGRGEAWALMTLDFKHDFLAFHYAAKRFLNIVDMTRVEAHVDVGFDCAKRWVERLGFEFEGKMRAYTPDGRDCLRYARVK
jgi:hypothetical protein